MKAIWILILALGFLSPRPLQAQDAATEERLNKLSGKIEDLIAGQESQRQRIAELAREIQALRDEQSKPSPNYAAQDDLKRLAEAVKEVDRKRMDDNEKVRAELLKLIKGLNSAPPSRRPPPEPERTEKSTGPEKGFEYTVQKGDTLSVIVAAYREKNIKITTEQILKANPGLKPERMQVGQKLFIPAPAP